MESEIRTCVCIKCKNTQNEMINYERATCSHVIHAILTLFTLFWGIIWWMRWQKSKADTEKNIKNSVSAAKCDVCNARVMLLSN